MTVDEVRARVAKAVEHELRVSDWVTTADALRLLRIVDDQAEVLRASALGDAHAADVFAYLFGDRVNVPMSAGHGGCWFCHRSGADLFCKGWDTFYHQVCLDTERRDSPDNPELTEFA